MKTNVEPEKLEKKFDDYVEKRIDEIMSDSRMSNFVTAIADHAGIGKLKRDELIEMIYAITAQHVAGVIYDSIASVNLENMRPASFALN